MTVLKAITVNATRIALSSAMALALIAQTVPANAANGSLEFCPFLPYLAKDNVQTVQDEFDWTLYQVDAEGRNMLLEQGRGRGCQVASPAGDAVYRVGMQGDCLTGFHLTGMSPAIWVPADGEQVHARVDGQWSKC